MHNVNIITINCTRMVMFRMRVSVASVLVWHCVNCIVLINVLTITSVVCDISGCDPDAISLEQAEVLEKLGDA